MNFKHQALLTARTAGFLLLAAGPVCAGLVGVNLFDNTTYQQTSGAAPSTASSYFFNIGGNMQNASDFTSASASFPGTSNLNLPINGTNFGYGSSAFASLAALHAAFPFGAYTVTATNSGTSATQMGVMNYAADYFTSAIPALTATTYNGLNGMNPSATFPVAFNSFTPNASVSQGLTFFTIYDGTTGNIVFTDGFLPPTTTGVTVPANTLLPNKTYLFELDFSDRLNGRDSVNQVFTEQGFDVRTDGSFTTGAAAPEPGSALLMSVGVGFGFLVRYLRLRRAGSSN